MKIEVNFIRSRKKDIPVNLEDAWRVYEEELRNVPKSPIKKKVKNFLLYTLKLL